MIVGTLDKNALSSQDQVVECDTLRRLLSPESSKNTLIDFLDLGHSFLIVT